SGFTGPSDGRIDIYANNSMIAYITTAGLTINAGKKLLIGSADHRDNGDTFGSIWGGWLSSHILDTVLPVGIPQPYPGATPPAGWLKCNGASFDKTKYPKLARAYPGGKLPDLRSEFIRGWDDGRGVNNQGLLEWRSDDIKSHKHTLYAASTDRGASGGAGSFYTSNPSTIAMHETTIGNTGGTETRPRNIAFNYIVRAA
ncbi:MAG: phage tail protein, partial [Enterobacteriaceae bacterium]